MSLRGLIGYQMFKEGFKRSNTNAAVTKKGIPGHVKKGIKNLQKAFKEQGIPTELPKDVQAGHMQRIFGQYFEQLNSNKAFSKFVTDNRRNTAEKTLKTNTERVGKLIKDFENKPQTGFIPFNTNIKLKDLCNNQSPKLRDLIGSGK